MVSVQPVHDGLDNAAVQLCSECWLLPGTAPLYAAHLQTETCTGYRFVWYCQADLSILLNKNMEDGSVMSHSAASDSVGPFHHQTVLPRSRSRSID